MQQHGCLFANGANQFRVGVPDPGHGNTRHRVQVFAAGGADPDADGADPVGNAGAAAKQRKNVAQVVGEEIRHEHLLRAVAHRDGDRGGPVAVLFLAGTHREEPRGLPRRCKHLRG